MTQDQDQDQEEKKPKPIKKWHDVSRLKHRSYHDDAITIPSGRILPKDEIVDRIARWKAGAPSSVLNPIVSGLKNLVRAAAVEQQRFGRGCVSVEDLMAQGMLGVTQAMLSFDGTQGTAFSSWAMYSIVGEMKKLVWRNSFRVNVTFHIKKVKSRDLLQFYREDSEGIDMLAMMHGVKREWLIAYAKILHGQRFSQYADIEDPSQSVHFVAESDPEQDYAAAEESAIAYDQVHQALSGFLPRQRDVIERRLLRDAEDQDTLKDIGEDWNVTRERIRQLERQVTVRLTEVLAPGKSAILKLPKAPKKPKPESDSDGNLTIAQAAEYLQRSISSLRYWHQKGKLVPKRNKRNARVYTRAQLDEFEVARREKKAEATLGPSEITPSDG